MSESNNPAKKHQSRSSNVGKIRSESIGQVVPIGSSMEVIGAIDENLSKRERESERRGSPPNPAVSKKDDDENSESESGEEADAAAAEDDALLSSQ